MILQFNPVEQPIPRWNKEWDYSSPHAKSGDDVDEDEVPLELPLGQSRTVKGVAEYMSQVVEDRILHILQGVSSACVQAKAWLMVTGRGMNDFAPQILSQAADKNAVVLASYCMEDFCTPVETGLALDRKNFLTADGESLDEPLIKDRVPGGKAFCESLHKFSGIATAEDAVVRPRVFVENIDDVMEKFRQMRLQTVERKPAKKKVRTKGRTITKTVMVKQQESCVQNLHAFFKNYAYLPPKDVTQLIVFQSRAAADAFKSTIEARVCVGHFLMEGSTQAMKMFDSSMKTGRPVFIMHGTGGAADSIRLVLDHMRYRKMLDTHENKGNVEGDGSANDESPQSQSVGCFAHIFGGNRNSNHKVHPMPEGLVKDDRAEKSLATSSEVEHDAKIESGGLADLESKIATGLERFQGTLTTLDDTSAALSASTLVQSDLFEKLDKQSRILWLKKVSKQVQIMKKNFEDLLALPPEEMLNTTKSNNLKRELESLHKEVDKILNGVIDRDKAKEGVSSEGSTSTSSNIGAKALDLHFADDHGTTDDPKTKVETATMKVKGGTPELLYYSELKTAREGLKFEAKLGCEYLGSMEADYTHIAVANRAGGKGRKDWKSMKDAIDDMPSAWTLPDEFDPECENGDDDAKPPGKVPCRLEICPRCNRFKNKERRWLRSIGRANLPWESLSAETTRNYITFWMHEHPLVERDRDVLDPEAKLVAKQARTTFTNIYEPPIGDACVSINILAKDLNVEGIMDNVTSAMSINRVDSEVGEKKAFRQRLLIAWQMVNQLLHNASIQKTREHALNLLIIIFTFLAIVSGTLSFEWQDTLIRGPPFLLFGEELSDQTVAGISLAFGLSNLLLPMLSTFFLGMRSALSPTSKYLALYHQSLYVESEIYKVRARVGDYSPHAAQGSAATAGGKDGGKGKGDGDGDKKDAKKGPVAAQPKNPRLLFSERVDSVWTDLGASELRQESLSEPKNLNLVDLQKKFTVQQHPSLFEQGHLLLSSNKTAKSEALNRLSYQFEDDGLKFLSTQDYVEVRINPYEKTYAKRAEALGLRLQTFQVCIFVLTSLSTLLGCHEFLTACFFMYLPHVLTLTLRRALKLPHFITLSLGFGSVFSAILEYQDVETRMERVNSANISLQKLMVWWHGLSVIEKRIPSNKTMLVETMESIILAEAGSVVMGQGDGGKADDAEGGE